jgi:hypothetical protein
MNLLMAFRPIALINKLLKNKTLDGDTILSTNQINGLKSERNKQGKFAYEIFRNLKDTCIFMQAGIWHIFIVSSPSCTVIPA